MIKPTLIIEWEFDAGVWTDITDDVVEISTRRGKNQELGAYETGTMNLVLRNETRDYDPGYAAGPHYGKLRPNRRIRFEAEYNAVTYPVFVGYVDRITMRGDGPNALVAEVALSDRFKILNRAELPRSVYTATVEADEPVIWYRLDEPQGSTVALNSGTAGADYNGTFGTGNPVVPAEGGELGEATLIVRDDGSAIRSDATHWSEIAIPAAFSVSLAEAFAIEAWVELGEVPGVGAAATRIFYQQGAGAAAGTVGFVILDDARPRLVIYNDAGTAYAVRTASALSLNRTYHLVARVDDDGTMHVFVDGADVTTADLGVGSTATGTVTKAGNAYLPQYWGYEAVIDEAAIYVSAGSEALTAAAIELHNEAGRTPWDGDTPGLRMSRVLALAEVPILEYDLATGEGTFQSTDLGGTALGYAQKIEETERGAFFVARDGTLVFLGRHDLQEDYLTSTVTLIDDPAGAGEVRYRTVSFEVDETDVITRATVSREGSIAVTYADVAAIDEFGPVDFTADGLLHDDDDYSAHYAEWIVNTHSTPSERVGTVTLTPPADPTVMYPELLGLELADRVTLTRRYAVGAAKTGDYRVESISHAVGAGWTTTLELSPFGVGDDNLPVFVWGETEWGAHVWGL